jgi:hypothetical protein
MAICMKLQRDAGFYREKAEADREQAAATAKRATHSLERKITVLEGQLANAASQAEESRQSLATELRQARLQADQSARSQR